MTTLAVDYFYFYIKYEQSSNENDEFIFDKALFNLQWKYLLL